jgi:hypothetical protein
MIPSPSFRASLASRSASHAFPADSLLLYLEQVHRNGVGLCHLDEFDPFGVEAGRTSRMPRSGV